ncbi:hypothetical protein D1010_07700 [Schleiferilactobacillus harbinensis]|uniref:Uncharacterized protein n=1 Tax=Schleiferilactobacillus harbinensis TaxID=304207 RepID=A0A5P8M481_9LACO|nr:hypothetical protein D1010_07700 [Schleiferilactobacillus harbinensis]
MRSKRRQNGLSGGNHTAALPPMWLGDLKTAVFAGFKRRHHVPAQFCRSLRSIGTAINEESSGLEKTKPARIAYRL